MSRERQVSLSPELREKLLRLLGNGESISSSRIASIDVEGDKFISLSHLENWLTQLAEGAMSDQKQEAFRGVRDYLHHLVRS